VLPWNSRDSNSFLSRIDSAGCLQFSLALVFDPVFDCSRFNLELLSFRQWDIFHQNPFGSDASLVSGFRIFGFYFFNQPQSGKSNRTIATKGELNEWKKPLNGVVRSMLDEPKFHLPQLPAFLHKEFNWCPVASTDEILNPAASLPAGFFRETTENLPGPANGAYPNPLQPESESAASGRTCPQHLSTLIKN
jgi:hypothetical protein